MNFKSIILFFVIALTNTSFYSSYGTNQEVSTNFYRLREQKLIEQLFFDKFSLLDENISEEFIEKFDAPINLFWEYNREQFIRRDSISQQERDEMITNLPKIDTVFVFLTDEQYIYDFLGNIIPVYNNFERGSVHLVPASFSNSKLFISQLIDYYNLNSNPEHNPNLKEQWSYGTTQYIRKNSSPFLVPSRNSISGRDILITLEENTSVRIVRSIPSPFYTNPYQINRFFEEYGLLHEIIVLDGDFEGRRGFIPHYYLK